MYYNSDTRRVAHFQILTMSLLTDAAFVTSRTVTENYTPVVTQAVAYTPLWVYLVLLPFLIGLTIAFGIYVLLTSPRLRKKFSACLTKAVFDVIMKTIKNKKKEKLLRARVDLQTAVSPPTVPEPVAPPVFPDVPPLVVRGCSEPVVLKPEPEPKAPPSVDPVLLSRLAEMVILIQQNRTPSPPGPD